MSRIGDAIIEDNNYEEYECSQFEEFPGATCVMLENGKVVRYEFTEGGEWVQI